MGRSNCIFGASTRFCGFPNPAVPGSGGDGRWLGHTNISHVQCYPWASMLGALAAPWDNGPLASLGPVSLGGGRREGGSLEGTVGGAVYLSVRLGELAAAGLTAALVPHRGRRREERAARTSPGAESCMAGRASPNASTSETWAFLPPAQLCPLGWGSHWSPVRSGQ